MLLDAPRLAPFALGLLLGLSGCARCGRAVSADAGGPDGSAKVERSKRAIDLRTALFTVFPEFRFATLLQGSAAVTRKVRWVPPQGASLESVVAAGAARNGFQPSDGGWLRQPFLLTAKAEGDVVELSAMLPIANEDVGRLLQSPSPMTSEQMATYLPELPGGTLLEETFVLSIHYVAPEQHAGFLAKQMVELLAAADWKVERYPEGWEKRPDDGGFGASPDRYSLTAVRAHSATKVHVERDGGHVRANLVQQVVGP